MKVFKEKLKVLTVFGLIMSMAFTGCANTKQTEGNTQEGSDSANTVSISDTVEPVTIDETTTTDFSLLDVTAESIETCLYSKTAEGAEVVFTKFTASNGDSMAALAVIENDGASGTVKCGTYKARNEADADGVMWNYAEISDIYTGESIEVGYVADETATKINDGTAVFDAESIDSTQAVTYMGIAATFVNTSTGTEVAEDDKEISPDSEGTAKFDILSVTADRVKTGIYAIDDVYNETVISLFTDETGTDMAAYVTIATDGTGTLACGTYTADTNVGEDGTILTILTIDDIYSETQVSCTYAELADGTCNIVEGENTISAEYIDADTTVNYMGVGLSFVTES